ncbi:MAG TPA: TIM barrel protein [Candidatus Hydrogenedentes bacterium]|nr:TIM barrel protein [Candidatus Hydrogenedentota bacterium]HNT87122.1 TIM barrel protein [Candidatus Hydrogenedentota bacterium]
MRLSIGGYSFHRLLEAGRQDMFRYIRDCKELGATQLDPWNAQLAPIRDADQVVHAGSDPGHAQLTAQDDAYLMRVREAAEEAGLPFGCIAVDGAHIYEPDPAARDANRRLADRWLEVARILGAPQVRIDAGGPEDLPDDVFAIIVAGYRDLIARAAAKGIEILMENHWGPSVIPENVVRVLDAVEGLGLLLDSNNWAPGMTERGWELCAKYARSTHFKTFSFDDQGNEPSVDLPRAVRLLVEAGYDGCWGIESCPTDGDEYGAVRKTAALLKRALAALGK